MKMIQELESYKIMREKYGDSIPDSEAFNNYMNIIYDTLDDYVIEVTKSNKYKEDILNKFKSYNTDNIDNNKLIYYFQYNPLGVYIGIIDIIDYLRRVYAKNNKFTISNRINYSKLKFKCKRKLKYINNDFILKYKNGYFNKEGK